MIAPAPAVQVAGCQQHADGQQGDPQAQVEGGAGRAHLLKPCRAWWRSFPVSLAQLCSRSNGGLGMGAITAGSDHTAWMASKSAGVNGRMISRFVVMGRARSHVSRRQQTT